jgi:hypothetical protein
MTENPMVRHTRWQLNQLGGPICAPYEWSLPWPGPSGGCHVCDVRVKQQLDAYEAWSRPMIVCADCGNKRCPKATWHENACSGSNEPDQEAKCPDTNFRIEQVRALMEAHDLLLEEIVRADTAQPVAELPPAALGPDQGRYMLSTLYLLADMDADGIPTHQQDQARRNDTEGGAK